MSPAQSWHKRVQIPLGIAPAYAKAKYDPVLFSLLPESWKVWRSTSYCAVLGGIIFFQTQSSSVLDVKLTFAIVVRRKPKKAPECSTQRQLLSI